MKIPNFLKRKTKNTCIFCGVVIKGKHGVIRYQYTDEEFAEPKIGTGYVCDKCTTEMDQTSIGEDV